MLPERRRGNLVHCRRMVHRLSVDDGLGPLSYEANEDPVGTTDLAIFVLRFFALFVALLAAFLSAFFAIFRNLLCLTMMRSISRLGYPSHFKSSGSLAKLVAIGRGTLD